MQIYLAFNKNNNKYYVGKTSRSLAWRWKKHIESAKADSPYYFHKAIRKHGESAFEHQILSETENDAHADNLERLWIILLQSNNPVFGYNQTDGGEGFTGTHTPEARKKMSRAKVGHIPWNKGKVGITKMSEETKAKMRAAHYPGRIYPSLSPEHRLKFSMKGKVAWNKGRQTPENEMTAVREGHKQWLENGGIKTRTSLKGRKYSEEHKRKIALASAQRWADPEYKQKVITAMRARGLARNENTEINNGATL